MNTKEHSYQGLTSLQAKKNQEQYGENLLTPPKRKPWWILYMGQFNDPVIKILLVAALISIITGVVSGHGYLESVGILVAVFLATFMAFINEYKAGKEFDVLNKVSDDQPYTVKRDGQLISILKKEITVDDLLLLEAGQEIPSDGLVLSSVELTVNESSLTGESITITKSVLDESHSDTSNYPYFKLFKGTLIATGYGEMKVTSIGDSTEMGKTARQSSEETENISPLTKQLTGLSQVIGRVGISLSLFLLVVLIIKNFNAGLLGMHLSWSQNLINFIDIAMVSIALIVMSVPEGLPMSVTLSLAYSMRKMIKNHALVRKMDSCETIGAVTVICTDKTGTLTLNQMRVAKLEADGVAPGLIDASLAINSTANLDANGEVLGNPSEGALLLYLKDKGLNYQYLRDEFAIIHQKPFSTEHKYMATYGLLGNKKIVLVKGAPEKLVERCASFASSNKEEWKERIIAQQKLARRVLGLAYIEVNTENDADLDALNPLQWLGFVAIADPLRDDAKQAVEQCQQAGIQIKMITGDSIDTALSIGKQLELVKDDKNVIEGQVLESLTDEELNQKVGDITVMARSRPMDKLRLLKALQAKGEVVAMTGDGTNDAPALNYADVGLSMGITGTAVAKEASDIILTNDSFSTIVQAIIWGRSLYLNISRFILFQLTANVSAVFIALLGPFIGVTMPFTVMQILWINLVFDTFAALALSTEGADHSVIHHKPRENNAFIITKAMAIQLFTTAFFVVVASVGYLLHFNNALVDEMQELVDPHYSSQFFNFFVLVLFWNLFNVRFYGCRFSFKKLFSNRTFYLIAVLILLGQFLIIEFGSVYFRTEPIAPFHFLQLVALTSLFFFIPTLIRLMMAIFKRK